MGPNLPPPPPGAAPATGGRPYESSSVVGAVLLTIFAPFIALIVALLLRGSERDPARKHQLGTWAAISGAYLAVVVVFVIVLIASFGSSVQTDTSGPCVGGPEIGAVGVSLGDGRYRFPCAISGSTVQYFPEGETASP